MNITILIIAAVIIVLIMLLCGLAMKNAMAMPRSWNDDLMEYVRCEECHWTCKDDRALYGDPGPECKGCPLCFQSDVEG